MTKPCRIYTQPQGRLNDDDRLTLAKLLIKAGYTVSIKKDKSKNRNPIYIEFREEGDEF